MRIRILAALLLTASSALTPLLADEGEWPPDQLARFDRATWDGLRTRGLGLGPEQLWDGKGGGLLTATVQIAGCSAGFVSPEGLIATNHHCAFDAIQLASTPERNFLRDGFVARSRGEEVPARGGASRVLIPMSIVDVTDRVRGPGTPYSKATTDLGRFESVERARKEIVAECEKEPARRCQVASFFDGLSFKLMTQLELKDVRLVYAPPRAVGEYGGEDDNFRFPRHTGDFSILRAYVGPDGKPAPHAKENVPYRPATWLKVSTSGVAPGDLVMVMGYPGLTRRFLTPSEVRRHEDWGFPSRARTYASMIAMLDDEARKDPAVGLRVASWTKSLANRETNARGQIEGLRRNAVASRADVEATALAAFLTTPAAPAGAAAALAEMEAVLSKDRPTQEARFLLDEIASAESLLGASLTAVRWADERQKPDLERDAGFQERDLERARNRAKDFSRSYAPAAARRVLAYLISRTVASTGTSPALEAAFGAKSSADSVERKLVEMDASSRMGGEESRLASLAASLGALRTSEDPYVRLALSLHTELTSLRRAGKELSGALLRLRPVYLSALQAFRASKGRALYPDANGTLRVSFAEVMGYSPREAITVSPRTSIEGLLEKETGSEPFASPARVLDAVRKRSHGPWADKGLGTVPICFLANGDTTGGNSGSPAVNGRGELVGLNFDRVWENVAGDFGWNADRSRNVMVDVRYPLWLIDRVDGASALLKELVP